LTRGVMEAAKLMGSSPAEAQAEANSTAALREMALDSTVAEPEMPALDPDQLRALIEGLATKIEDIRRGSAPVLQAAE